MKKFALSLLSMALFLTGMGATDAMKSYFDSYVTIEGYVFDKGTGEKLTRNDLAKYGVKIIAAYPAMPTIAEPMNEKEAYFTVDGKYFVNVPAKNNVQTVAMKLKSPFYQPKEITLTVRNKMVYSFVAEKYSSTTNQEARAEVSGYLYDKTTKKMLTKDDLAKYGVKVLATLRDQTKEANYNADGKYIVSFPSDGTSQTMQIEVKSPFYKPLTVNVTVTDKAYRTIVIEKY